MLTRDVCIDVLPAFSDNNYNYATNPDGRYPGDDYLIDNTTAEPARGVWVEVEDNAVPGAVGTFADDGGATPGCAHFSVNTLKTYTVRVLTKAVVAGHTLNVYKPYMVGLPATNLYSLTVSTTWHPSIPAPGPTYTVNTGNQWWNILVAATWALHHRDGGMGLENNNRLAQDG